MGYLVLTMFDNAEVHGIEHGFWFYRKNVEGPGIILGRLTSLGKKLFNTFSKGERRRTMA